MTVLLEVEGRRPVATQPLGHPQQLPQRQRPGVDAQRLAQPDGDGRHHHRDRDQPAIEEITFQAGEGEILLIAGASGCGKTTLIRCISTLLMPDSGDIQVFDLDVQKDEMAVKRLIKYSVSCSITTSAKLSPDWGRASAG